MAMCRPDIVNYSRGLRRSFSAEVWLVLLQTYRLPYRWAARYPKTRLGRLATCTVHSKKTELCDDYIVQSNEFFFDRDPNVFHNIFNFYRFQNKPKVHA